MNGSNAAATPRQPLRIMLAVMSQSPFNRSIWRGMLDGFRSLGHTVEVFDAASLPEPGQLDAAPQLLFAVHGGNVPAERIEGYREAGIPTAVYLLDEPYEVDQSSVWARRFDHVFSVDRCTVPIHEQHTRAHFLPLAYNDQVFRPDGNAIPSDILVLGSPFAARLPYLEALRDQWGDRVTWVGPGWSRFSAVGRYVEQFVLPVDCARFYRGANMVINIHRDSTWSHFGELNSRGLEATHLNPRFWESAGCGTLVLSSYRADMSAFSLQAPAFNDVEGFASLIEGYLADPARRDADAAALYQCVRPHTYRSRCADVLAAVELTR